MDDILKIIRCIPGFDGLSDDQLRDIESIADTRSFKRGDMVFFEGDDGSGFYVVVKGRVKVFKNSSEGKEVILHICNKGDQFGQIVAYSSKAFPANAQVITDSHLLFFSRDQFVSLVEKTPSLAMNMLSIFAKRLRELTVQVEGLALKEVPGRLATYLLYLAAEQKNGNSVHLDTSKSQVASFLGTSSETFSRILTNMASRGLIHVDKRNITILDPVELEKLAEKGRFTP